MSGDKKRQKAIKQNAYIPALFFLKIPKHWYPYATIKSKVGKIWA